MQKNNKISPKALLLLLLYLFSICPAMLWHKHTHEVVAYKEATDCEKAIFYDNQEDNCEHKSHFSKPLEKCSICDHHTVVSHIQSVFSYQIYKLITYKKYLDVASGTSFLFSFITANRGPPAS